MTTEQLSIILGFLTLCGTGISALFGKFAWWVSKRITDCETDRQALREKIEKDSDEYAAKTEVLHTQLSELSLHLVRIEKHFEFIDKRNVEHDQENSQRK